LDTSASWTAIVDEVATLRPGTRLGGGKSANWLEPELAMSAKQSRRQLERLRRWMNKSGFE